MSAQCPPPPSSLASRHPASLALCAVRHSTHPPILTVFSPGLALLVLRLGVLLATHRQVQRSMPLSFEPLNKCHSTQFL
ncbi:hypothetical protein BDZ90DRAFT_229384 [Jaminaea rosea]|uniref:Uncharacterized protein n=1 Tax=Jaminaea rosea TaxID=1569628 RepID=A0A316V2F3_9BASI|nr:hypothetical protein BDZ90DRAFT_229384 [Jaminaea rosea]PWN30363.1 hypothetical protein BDZ90DRAFT_229384 [Jaminaea rosea]